jgi:hypothetical protein
LVKDDNMLLKNLNHKGTKYTKAHFPLCSSCLRGSYLWIGVVAVGAAVCHGRLLADPPKPPPVSILISDDPPAQSLPPSVVSVGQSPYANWPDEGMRPLPDQAARLAEIHPQQADWINAAFANLDYRSDAHCRAGWPECVRPRAVPSDTGRYCGYAVGGGAVCLGEGFYLDEGTWGWDYHGIVLHKRIALDWWHGRYQGGAGQYQTDGPKLRHE